MKKGTKILIASGIGLLAGAAGAAVYAYLKKRELEKKAITENEDEMYLDFSGEVAVSYEDAAKKAEIAAGKIFGNDASVVSASDEKAITANINGETRHCYLFGAVSDNPSATSESLLLYVDASTGEVFESEKSN